MSKIRLLEEKTSANNKHDDSANDVVSAPLFISCLSRFFRSHHCHQPSPVGVLSDWIPSFVLQVHPSGSSCHRTSTASAASASGFCHMFEIAHLTWILPSVDRNSPSRPSGPSMAASVCTDNTYNERSPSQTLAVLTGNILGDFWEQFITIVRVVCLPSQSLYPPPWTLSK